MSDNPGEQPDNPFKGTPFEQFFGGADARPRRADEPGAGDDGAARRRGELDPGRRHRPTLGGPAARPLPHDRASRTRSPTRVRLADHWLDEATDVPLRRHLHRGLEPRRVDRVHPRRLAAAGRAGRRARRRRHGQRAPAGGPGDGRPADGHARPDGRRDVRHPGRSGARRPGHRGAHRLRHRAAARPGRQGRAAARPTSPRSPRASTSARTTCCSTSRSARPPTSASSPTCRGCASTCCRRSPTTAAASPSTPPASRSRSGASTRPTRPRSSRRSRAACSSRRRPRRRRPR